MDGIYTSESEGCKTASEANCEKKQNIERCHQKKRVNIPSNESLSWCMLFVVINVTAAMFAVHSTQGQKLPSIVFVFVRRPKAKKHGITAKPQKWLQWTRISQNEVTLIVQKKRHLYFEPDVFTTLTWLWFVVLNFQESRRCEAMKHASFPGPKLCH